LGIGNWKSEEETPCRRKLAFVASTIEAAKTYLWGGEREGDDVKRWSFGERATDESSRKIKNYFASQSSITLQL
jgi:hypothetical protein